ncbi:restriction endonuclease subunit S [Amylibacter sp.]|nr:restriction endonuclease subunit S [Amylibacter sp.]
MSDPLKEFSWGELLDPIKSSVDMRDDALFPLASIRRRNGGFFHRETKLGREILTKTLSKAVSGSFAISRMQVVHGACSYVPESFGETFLSASYTQFQAKNPPRIDTKYLHYYAHSRESYSAFLKSSHGVHIEKMTFDLKDWLRQKVSLPPLPEQKKITSILTSVDDVIETTQKQIDKLQDLKKATMNELLTKGIGHTEFKDSELGRIPKSWEVKRLGDLLELKNGINTDKDAFGSGFPFITYKDVHSGDDLNETSLTKFVKLSSKEHTAFSVNFGDIFFTRTSETPEEIGLSNTYLGKNIGAVFNGFCIRGRPKTKLLSAKISKYLFRSDYVRTQMKFLCKYTTRAGISGESLNRCLIALPSMIDQHLFENILINIDKNIWINVRKLAQTQSLKKSLMQDLLTGKVRVQVH